MMKRVLRYLIAFALGACAFGMAQAVIVAIRGRVGCLGGEIFTLPLLAGVAYIGWMLSKTYHRDKLKAKSEAIYKSGFIAGAAATLKDITDVCQKRGGADDEV